MLNRLLNRFLFLDHDNFEFSNKFKWIKKKHSALKKEKINLNFFNYHFTNSEACGPLQKDEAIFLYGFIKCLNPKVVLEFGFNRGHSALCFLEALDKDSKFFTVDNQQYCRNIFNTQFQKKFSNAKLIINDMSKINFGDYFSTGEIQFVFFDAVHDFTINLATYENLKKFMSSDNIIVIHDTGLWNYKHMTDKHHRILKNIKHKKIGNDLYAHQIDERKFSNYLVENEGYKVLHIHSQTTLRHGLSILHKQINILEV